MSSSVEDRIIAMKFENKQFETGISSTLRSLDQLKRGMDLGAAGSMATRGLGFLSSALSKFGIKNPFATPQRGLEELSTATSRFSMGTIEGGITSVSRGFVAMSTVAVTALATIVSEAVRAGGRIASAFTIQPVMTGLQEYEATLNSTQTVMSATGESVEEVTATLEDLNRYSDRTIYSFADMTKNITAFTNAGIASKPAAQIMKGIANASASAGVSAEAAGRAMFAFGQSMSLGYIGLQDWNQVDAAGLATKEFKNELIDAAVAAGTLTRGIDGTARTAKGTEVNFKNFRNTLNEQWASSEILTKTLAKYSDTSTEVGKKAAENAQRVKTLSQMMDVLKEGVQSGWSESFKQLFGNLDEATKLWTGVNDVVGGFLGKMGNNRNKMLTEFKELGGRKDLIKGIGASFSALFSILKPIRNAFRDIFPRKTGADLADLASRFREFAEGLTIGKDTAQDLRATFRGVFAIFSIAGQVIEGVVGLFGRLFGAIGSGSGDFLSFTGGVGDTLVAFDEMLDKGGLIDGFFKGLGDVLAVPLNLLRRLAGFIGGLFSGFDSGKAGDFSDSIGSVGDKLKPLEKAGDRVMAIFRGIGNILGKVGDVIGQAMSGIGDAIGDAFSSQNFDRALDLLNTALLGGIVLMLKNFFNGDLISIDTGTGGLFDSVKETLGSVTDALSTMQASVKGDVLLKIAGALAILVASIVVLSLIDSKKLATAMVAMSALFLGLQAAMVSLNSAIGIIGAAKLLAIATAMAILGGAMLLFTTSLLLLSTIRFAEMVRGLIGIAGVMFILTKAVGPLSKNSAGMITAGVGLTAVAVALNIMAVALKSFAEMSYEEMARGLAGAAGSLLVLAGAMRLMPKGMVAQAAALVIVAGALKILASAVEDFAALDYQTMGRGMVGIAGSLLILAAAMRLMPKNMLVQAAALVLVGAALQIIQGAVAAFGDMTMEQIATGLIALGGSLLVLAAGLTLMTGSLAGSAALLVAAGALAILVPLLIIMGSMSITQIATALVVLGGAFLVLGGAGVLLGPLVPILLGLGAALLLIGAGFALAGAGALAFATAFGIFVGAGSAGIAVLTALLNVIIKAIPRVSKAFGQAIIEMLKAAVKAVPLVLQAINDMISGILDIIIKNAPKAAKAFLAILDAFLKVIVQATPKIATAGLSLMIGLLTAISGKIGEITKLAVDIIVKFVDALANNLDRIIQSGVNLIIKFIQGVTKAINNNSVAIGEAGGDLAVAMVNGMVNGLNAGAGRIADAAMDAARAAYDKVKDFFKIFSPSRKMRELGQYVSEGLAIGITDGEGGAVKAMDHMAQLIDDAAKGATAEVERLKSKLEGLRKMKGDHSKEIAETEKLLKAAKNEQKEAEAAHQAWMKGSKEERAAMKEQGKLYDAKLQQIQKEKDKLQELVDLRQQEADSIASQYAGSPDLQNEEEDRQLTPEEYAAELAAKAAATEQFAKDLETLRGMGMDDATYRKLLEEGLDAAPFVQQMIAGGADMVAQINANQARLTAAATALGTQAADDMHNAGIQTQAGLVAGLELESEEIEKAMKKLARKMIRALKKALGIKSPSREFMKIGRFSSEGMAVGLDAYSGVVEKAAVGVGNKALDTLRVSMSKVGDAVGGNLDIQPTIAPVLDLTQLQKEATKIGGMLDTGIITPTMSFEQASAIADAAQAAKDAAAESSSNGDTYITLEQTNNSPKALDPSDSFRNTKSGLSLMKEALSSNGNNP